MPRSGAALLAAAALLLAPLLAAALDPLPRGNPASRLPATATASEYWDLVALFDSNHKLFARFMITNEGPGEQTGIAYGHFLEPDGKARFFSNGRLKGRWSLGPRGLRLKIGSSLLDQTGPVNILDVDKGKKGVKIHLSFTPQGPAAWDPDDGGDSPSVDLLDASAPIAGSVWFRDMPEAVALEGRVGVTHTWMARSESEVALRRIDCFSLRGDPVLYLQDFTAPDGSRRHWLVIVSKRKILHQSNDFELDYAGRSSAQESADYPLPGELRIRGAEVEGRIFIESGLIHHDPMQEIPQPFRFLLSFRMRPHRVWTNARFEVTLRPNSDLPPFKIRGAGLATATFLNPCPSLQSRISPRSFGA